MIKVGSRAKEKNSISFVVQYGFEVKAGKEKKKKEKNTTQFSLDRQKVIFHSAMAIFFLFLFSFMSQIIA